MGAKVVEKRKDEIVHSLRSGNVEKATKGLKQLKFDVNDVDEEALLNTALLYVGIGKVGVAIDMLEKSDKRVFSQMLMKRFINGRNIGELEILPLLPLSMIAENMKPKKPKAARALDFGGM